MPFSLFAQEQTITGHVLDGDFDNAPLVGATVKVEDKENNNLLQGTATDIDGKFSLDATRCIGACGLAPVLTVNDEVYGRLTVDDVDDILAKYMN